MIPPKFTVNVEGVTPETRIREILHVDRVSEWVEQRVRQEMAMHPLPGVTEVTASDEAKVLAAYAQQVAMKDDATEVLREALALMRWKHGGGP